MTFINTPIKKLVLSGIAATFLLSATSSPAEAQGYHYNYGNSRVINQGNIGIYRSESTYIPTGAINNTAKGHITGGLGQSANPLLPKVPWGKNINTPGDNFYMGGAPATPDAPLPGYMQPRRSIQLSPQQQAQLRQRQQGTLYIPGQNAGTGNGYSSSTGAATYGSGAAYSY